MGHKDVRDGPWKMGRGRRATRRGNSTGKGKEPGEPEVPEGPMNAYKIRKSRRKPGGVTGVRLQKS